MVNFSQVEEVTLNNKNVEEIQKNGVTLWKSPPLESPYLMITFNSSLTEYGTNGLIGTNIQYSVDDGEWINYDGKLSVTGSKVKIKNVTTLGTNCFYGCTGLTSIDLGNITTLVAGCFKDCTSLTSIEFGDVTSIGDYCFYGCTGLTGIDLTGINSVGGFCFYGCTGLTSIDLGNITTLVAGCFKDCTSLNNVMFHTTTPPQMFLRPFYNISPNPVAHVPTGTTIAYTQALQDSGATFTVIEDDQ